MKKTKTTPQKAKSFDAKKKGSLKEKNKVYGKKERENIKVKKTETRFIDELSLFEKLNKKLEIENIYLLNIRLALLKKDKHIYAVIHKKPDVSHKDCITATKAVQTVIKEGGFDEGDYNITVSSAGFSWGFKSDREYSVFEDNNIKIKYFVYDNTESNEGKKAVSEKGILKENKESAIIFIREDGKKIEIKKEDIIKARLNN